MMHHLNFLQKAKPQEEPNSESEECKNFKEETIFKYKELSR